MAPSALGRMATSLPVLDSTTICCTDVPVLDRRAESGRAALLPRGVLVAVRGAPVDDESVDAPGRAVDEVRVEAVEDARVATDEEATDDVDDA